MKVKCILDEFVHSIGVLLINGQLYIYIHNNSYQTFPE